MRTGARENHCLFRPRPPSRWSRHDKRHLDGTGYPGSCSRKIAGGRPNSALGAGSGDGKPVSSGYPVCSITVEHASQRADAPHFSYEEVAA